MVLCAVTKTIKGHMSNVHGIFLIPRHIIFPVDLQKKKSVSQELFLELKYLNTGILSNTFFNANRIHAP